MPANALAFQEKQAYRLAIPVRSSIAQKYARIADSAGYIEQYPEISSSEMTSYQGKRVVKSAALAFHAMRRQALRNGVNLRIVSGFRGIQEQRRIFERKAQQSSNSIAAKYSAPPGFSQHHTGLAIDINSVENPDWKTRAGLKTFYWLQEHAAEYGFILSYPEGSNLGPQAEPWHWVYVGNRPAMTIMTGFIERARRNGYDPLEGSPQLAALYQSITISRS